MYAKPYKFVSDRGPNREYEIPAMICVCEMCEQRGRVLDDCNTCDGTAKVRRIDEEACEQDPRLKVLLKHYFKQLDSMIRHDNMCRMERMRGA